MISNVITLILTLCYILIVKKIKEQLMQLDLKVEFKNSIDICTLDKLFYLSIFNRINDLKNVKWNQVYVK